MSTNRTRKRRNYKPEIEPALLRWLAGTGPMPVEGYFLMPEEEAALRETHKRAIAIEAAGRER